VGSGGQFVGLTTLPILYAGCFEVWEPLGLSILVQGLIYLYKLNLPTTLRPRRQYCYYSLKLQKVRCLAPRLLQRISDDGDFKLSIQSGSIKLSLNSFQCSVNGHTAALQFPKTF
jgi:hypothetical protein